MKVPVLLRTIGDSWAVGETVDLSASGAWFVTNRALLPGVVIEYVLTFPTDLTKARRPLHLRFLGTVVRCETVSEISGAFGIAVRSRGHHYVSNVSIEESASFDAIEKQLLAASTLAASTPSR